ATDSTAPATVFGISWSLRSRKILKPRSAISRTQSGPLAVNISKPIFTQRTVPCSCRRAGVTSREDWASRTRMRSQGMAKKADGLARASPMFSSRAVNPVVYSCPAKLNLLLAVTGRRPDGFHELVSVVAPVEFGDTLTVEPAAEFSLSCDDPTLPTDASNLVLKAAQAFRTATGWKGGARFALAKRIPMAAGLGGGSSDAAAALSALNQLAGGTLSAPALAQVAAEVGSDCALFLPGGPVVMRGRGERVERLREAAATGLRGRRVLIFK